MHFRIGNEDAVGTTYGGRGRNIDESLDVEEEEVKERKYAENVYSTCKRVYKPFINPVKINVTS